MNDELRERDKTFRTTGRSAGLPPQEPSQPESAGGWFGRNPGEESHAQAPQAPQAPPPDGRGRDRADPEQRYADALAALNSMVATFDFRALQWVTGVLRTTAGALHEQDPARPSVLNNLGSAAQLAHVAEGEIADLEDAVGYYRSAATTAQDDDPDLPLYLCNLALALTDCAARTGTAGYAEEAVRAARHATKRTDREHRYRTTALTRLANALKLHARLGENPDSDDESVEVFREVVRALPSAGQRPDGPDLLISLGSALLRRHERSAVPENLDEGISHLHSGVGLLADGEHRRSALLHLAEALRLRYRRRGDLTDLQTAIDELLGVLGVLPEGNPLLGKTVWNLTSATAEYVESTGEPGNLQQALRAVGPVVRGISADDADRGVALAGYGALARRHFLNGASPAALDTAVAAGEAAAEADGTVAKRCAVLNSLTSTLITRYEHSGDSGDLDRAAEVAELVYRQAPDRAVPQYTACAQLGVLATHRYRAGSDTGELETAMEMFDRALIAMPKHAPDRVLVSTHLGHTLQTLFRRTGRRKLYRWARKTLTEAANQPTGPADQRLRAANLCGRLAAQSHRWSEALEAFTLAVELLPLVTQGKRAIAAPAVQRRWAHLTADAAACALEVGRPDRAVELIEHGRAALYSELLPSGSELGRLHRQYPEVATDALRVRRLLDRPAEEPVLAGPDLVDDTERRDRLATAWGELLGEIRAESGHERYLRPVPFDHLAEPAGEGAVVLVNLSRYRSDALIVFAGRALVVPLPAAPPELAAEQAEALLADAQEPQRPDLEEQAASIEALDWMWHNIARPVLDRMGYTRTPEEGERWPRLWWCTSGPTAFLPLHAAAAEDGPCVLDRVISSYTPGLRVLGEALDRPPAEERARALIAAGPAQQLARHDESAQYRIPAQYWPSAAVFSDQEATADEVLGSLPDHPLLHVAEPSTQDVVQPAASLLLDREPRDRSLGLVDLGQESLEEAEFAYLGRCGSTGGTPSAAALTLAGALAFAGFAHIVSTLWAVDGESAAVVSRQVYAELAHSGGFDPDRSAVALHTVSRQLRARYPDRPSTWAAHTHTGV